MEHEKQYNLLRPLDLDQARQGKLICDDIDEPAIYVAGPDAKGDLCVLLKAEGYFALRPEDDFRMAPLTWVEGQPVYEGDVLYWNSKTHEPGSKFTVGSKMLDIDMIEGVSVTTNGKTYNKPGTGLLIRDLTWGIATAKQTVKLVAFIDDYGTLRWVREDMYKGMFTRVPSEDKVVEV